MTSFDKTILLGHPSLCSKSFDYLRNSDAFTLYRRLMYLSVKSDAFQRSYRCVFLHTGFSTFLGMFVLLFASSEIYRIFFRMFMGIVVFGLLHGLCILPVQLSFLNWKQAVTLDSHFTEHAVDDAEVDQNPQ